MLVGFFTKEKIISSHQPKYAQKNWKQSQIHVCIFTLLLVFTIAK